MRASQRCAGAHIAQRRWKTRSGICLKWLHWHRICTVKRCQASALLNAHVLLSFSWDGQWTCHK